MNSTRPQHPFGCAVCGAAIAYPPAGDPLRCVRCGETVAAAARCSAGHVVCDGCLGGTATDVIERACAASESTDPFAIARTLMNHPQLSHHGVEHHFLVPAALLAAHANSAGAPQARARLVAEARRRLPATRPGTCGDPGPCAAAIGAGLYGSVVGAELPVGAEPGELEAGARANALEVLSRMGGKRCCKRDSWLVLLATVKYAREKLGVPLRATRESCSFSSVNAECLGHRCPFHPGNEATEVGEA